LNKGLPSNETVVVCILGHRSYTRQLNNKDNRLNTITCTSSDNRPIACSREHYKMKQKTVRQVSQAKVNKTTSYIRLSKL